MRAQDEPHEGVRDSPGSFAIDLIAGGGDDSIEEGSPWLLDAMDSPGGAAGGGEGSGSGGGTEARLAVQEGGELGGGGGHITGGMEVGVDDAVRRPRRAGAPGGGIDEEEEQGGTGTGADAGGIGAGAGGDAGRDAGTGVGDAEHGVADVGLAVGEGADDADVAAVGRGDDAAPVLPGHADDADDAEVREDGDEISDADGEEGGDGNVGGNDNEEPILIMSQVVGEAVSPEAGRGQGGDEDGELGGGRGEHGAHVGVVEETDGGRKMGEEGEGSVLGKRRMEEDQEEDAACTICLEPFSNGAALLSLPMLPQLAAKLTL